MKHAKIAVWMVIALAAGAFLFAGCGGGDSDSAGPDVYVTGITLNIAEDDEQVLSVGDSFEITATITPPNATDKRIAWRSLYPNVALVLGNDLTVTVLAVTTGETIIMAVTEDGGILASCPVKVE